MVIEEEIRKSLPAINGISAVQLNDIRHSMPVVSHTTDPVTGSMQEINKKIHI